MGSLGEPLPITLLSGATGFIGFRILLELAYQGAPIRAVVRSPEKAKWLKERAESVLEAQGYSKSSYLLETCIVKDFATPNAFEDALSGITYVIHVANPITSGDTQEDWERDFIRGAVDSTIGLLESAKRTRSVKRVIITSSMVALFSPHELFVGSLDKSVLDAEMRTAEVSGPFPHKMLAYGAGKVAALNRAEQWIKKEQHHIQFDVIHMHPSFTIGRNELITTAEELRQFSSNLHALQIVLGTQCPAGKPMLTCHVDDVARVHVQALNPDVQGNQSFLISCGYQEGARWDDIRGLVSRKFPQAVEKRLVPNNGHMDTVNPNVKFDVSKTEKTFNFKHIDYEAQCIDLLEQYLSLRKEEIATET